MLQNLLPVNFPKTDSGVLRNFIRLAILRWIWAGVNPQDLTEVSEIKLTNTIALTATVILVLQLPIAFVFIEHQGWGKVIALCVVISFLSVVPDANRRGHPNLSKGVLIACYCFYICYSSLLWQQNLNHHYFLLLGLFVCPFLFPTEQETRVWQSVAVFSGLFISMDLYWRFSGIQQITTSIYENSLGTSNSVFFALSTMLCCFCIRKNLNRTKALLKKKQQHSESMLKEALPQHLLNYLRGPLQPRCYANVSVLFADLAGYSQMCREYPELELVQQLNTLYLKFDAICSRLGLVKIKTNGDEYLAACGLQNDSSSHARDCCQVALAMRDCHKAFRQQADKHQGIRIGIASGEVVAGVIGKKPLTYDIWGATVNLAARMESQGERDRIQVCERTYQLAKDHFHFSLTAQQNFKGIGKLNSYWLEEQAEYVHTEKL